MNPTDALRRIKAWTLEQPDTVWFDTVTTLHDFCEQALTAAAEVGAGAETVRCMELLTNAGYVICVNDTERHNEQVERYVTLGEAVRQQERKRCARVADSEPEAPGPMPDEFHLIPLEDAIRAAIRATKRAIAAAIREGKDE